MAHISTRARKNRKQTRAFINERMEVLTGRKHKWSMLNPVTGNSEELDALGMEGLLYSIIPAAREVEFKYGLAAARLMFTYDQMNSGYRDSSRLNDVIKIVTSAHSHEWDSDLRGYSLRELIDFFHNETKHLDDITKEELSELTLILNEDYEVRLIPDFQTAKEYANYTTWCITSSEAMWNSYSNDGINNVYFVVKKGFEVLEPINYEAKDEYGLSMISVIVRPYGTMGFCTGRYNHGLNGSDSLLTTKELSKLLGRNYYTTFLPKTCDEIEKIIFKHWEEVEGDSVTLNKGWKRIKRVKENHWRNSETIYTYYDPDKQYLVFDEVKEFDCNGLAVVQLNGKYNLINLKGDLIL